MLEQGHSDRLQRPSRHLPPCGCGGCCAAQAAGGYRCALPSGVGLQLDAAARGDRKPSGIGSRSGDVTRSEDERASRFGTGRSRVGTDGIERYRPTSADAARIEGMEDMPGDAVIGGCIAAGDDVERVTISDDRPQTLRKDGRAACTVRRDGERKGAQTVQRAWGARGHVGIADLYVARDSRRAALLRICN